MVSPDNCQTGSHSHELGFDLLGIRRYPITLYGRCLANGVDIHSNYARLLCRLLVGVTALGAE
jgi:hypothetical protein